MTEDGLTESELLEELEDENDARAKLGKHKIGLDEWKKMRTKRVKPLEP